MKHDSIGRGGEPERTETARRPLREELEVAAREVLREVRRSLTRRTVKLMARPVGEGKEPLFALEPEAGALPTGWVELSFTVRTEAPLEDAPLLIVHAEGGAPEGERTRLPFTASGEVRAMVRLPETLRALELVPVSRASRFELGPVQLRELGRSEATFRVVWPLARKLLGEPERIPQVVRKYLGSGLRGFEQRLGEKARAERPLDSYEDWLRQYDRLTDADREAIRRRVETFAFKPLISVVMPTYNPPERFLREALDSVLAQLYPHWELCIADDASTEPHVRRVLEEYARKDARIRFMVREENGHISAASNSALALARGEFVALMDHDDLLPEHALYFVAEELNAHPELDLLYSDEDKVDASGRRYEPYFKPSETASADLLHSQNVISHLGVYRTSVLRDVGGFVAGLEGSQDYDLALRVLERIPPSHVRHIPRVLYHWRAIEGSTALDIGAKSYATTAARKALQAHFERTGSGARCQPGPRGPLHRAVYPVPQPSPLVSIIVSTRLGRDAAARSVEQLRRVTRYPHSEFLTAGHSASVNAAAREARGEVLVFIDSGLEPLEPGWLEELVGQALRPEVGAVGARIVLPDDTIDHGGYLLGLGHEGIAGIAHRGERRDALGYFGRASIVQNFAAVSDAGLALRREVFDAVGGFDAAHLPDAWRDVDLCLRLRERGWRIVWTPYADLCRRELVPGGETPRVESTPEPAAYMKARWSAALREDPHYSLNLALGQEAFGLAWPPRVARPWLSGPGATPPPRAG